MALLRALRAAGLASPAAEAVLAEAGFETVADLAYVTAQDAADLGIAQEHAWATRQRDAVSAAARAKGLAVVRMESAIIQREAREAAAELAAARTSSSSTSSITTPRTSAPPPPAAARYSEALEFYSGASEIEDPVEEAARHPVRRRRCTT